MNQKTRTFKQHTKAHKMTVLGLGFLAYGLLVYLSGNTSICIFKVYTGLPCPGCGMTRAFMAVFHLDFHTAFFWHPLWPLVLIGPLLYYFAFRAGEKGRLYKRAIIFVSLVLLITTYIIRMFLYFPTSAPMDFNDNAIAVKIIHFLSRF